jgi:hypothetical protein
MSRSLTYAEIAEALRITPESANRLARRKRWPRMKGNDGRTRVAVPEEALVRPDSPPANPGDSPPAASPDNPVHAQIARLDRELAHAQIARMEGELAGIREARARASAVGARAEAAEARASEESAKIAHAIAALEQLAQRLEEMAAAKRPSWWRWLRFAD